MLTVVAFFDVLTKATLKLAATTKVYNCRQFLRGLENWRWYQLAYTGNQKQKI